MAVMRARLRFVTLSWIFGSSSRSTIDLAVVVT